MNHKSDSASNLFSLQGKYALITGGAGLLGREHARALLMSGANVILVDLQQSTLDRTIEELSQEFSSNEIYGFEANVSSEQDILRVSEALKKLGVQVSILINNAAINPKVKDVESSAIHTRLENFKVEEWNAHIAVGLTGAFLCAKVFGTQMASRNSGVILNIASDLSVISPDQRLYKVDGLQDFEQPVKPVPYSVIKTGIVGLTRYLATYWSENGVRVNALSPGGVLDVQNPSFLDRITSLIPLGRMANSSEYHGAVQFLCSDASSYLTGQNIVIDGGRSIW